MTEKSVLPLWFHLPREQLLGRVLRMHRLRQGRALENIAEYEIQNRAPPCATKHR